MAEMKRDQNFVTVGGGISSADETTPLMLTVDPATGYLNVELSMDAGGSATAMELDKRDQNFVPTVYGVSDADGVTPVPIRTDSDGKLLISFQ